MRLVFFGTPDFAARCLETILKSRHEVAAVVTAPDKPKGRGRKIEPSETKILAQQNALEILQPEKLKDRMFLEGLASIKADLFCVVAFRILPEEVFSMPHLGCINLHGSLLPKYRGAAPINWAIINGETETGLTTFFIRRQVDTGNIIQQDKLGIGPDETFGELHDRMASLGGDLLLKTIDLIESGNVPAIAQDNSLATPAPKLEPEMGRIDWSRPASDIHNLVRGLSPRPAAYSYIDDMKLTILKTRHIDDDKDDSKPGTLTSVDPQKGIIVACGKGKLEMVSIRPESGKTISAAEFVRGYRPSVGEVLKEKIGNEQQKQQQEY